METENSKSLELNQVVEKLENGLKKSESDKPFELKIDDVVRDPTLLSSTRECLLNIYHTSIQTHAGYLIAIIIGALTLLSRWDSFFSLDNRAVPFIMPIIFKGLMVLIFAVILWITLRIIYWTNYTNRAMTITPSGIVEYFNIKNLRPDFRYPYHEEPPLPTAMQWAIGENLEKAKEKNILPLYQRLASDSNDLKSLIWLPIISIGLFIVLLAF